MCSHHPESVVFPSESVETGSLCQVPDSDALVFAVAHDDVLSRVEEHTGNVVVVTSTRVNFPRLGICQNIIPTLYLMTSAMLGHLYSI